MKYTVGLIYYFDSFEKNFDISDKNIQHNHIFKIGRNKLNKVKFTIIVKVQSQYYCVLLPVE